MAINRISLKNFKCFQETDIEFGKITLLTGANSSGKSSLIHAILAILQTEGFPFYLSPNGKYVNMGDYEEMVFGYEKEHSLEIGCSFGNVNFQSTWNYDPKNSLPQLQRLIVSGPDEVEVYKNDVFQIKVKKSDSLDSDMGRDAAIAHIFHQTFRSDQTKIDFENQLIKQLKAQNGELINTQIEELGQFYELISGSGVLTISARNFEDVDDVFNYISPFRLPPQRTYYQTSNLNRKIDSDGQGYIDQIVEWEDNKAPELLQLIEILSDLKLLRKIKTQRLKGGRFELRVQVSSNKLWASLADVGFGISQFLPIIVADLQLKDDSTLILAQPEIHLHPNVQATLGDYFVKQATQKNKRYLVETHSEYLLNRIRLAIVKKEIKAEDVAVYYFENTPQGSETHRLLFTEDGQIQHAPKGFFDTYMIDTMEIALHA